MVFWGDGASRSAATSEEGGSGTFSAGHTYASHGDYAVTVCVTDDDGGRGCRTTTAVIANAAPTVDASADVSGVEGAVLSVAAAYGDAGAGGSHTAIVDWGDGASAIGVVDRRSGTVEARHTYAADGVYVVTICVSDSDGASGCDTLTATVANAAPQVSVMVEDSGSLVEGIAVTVGGVISDGGVSDTHTAIVDWGDGFSSGAFVVSVGPGEGAVTASHTYGDDGVYTVRVCVSDGDGGQGCSAIELHVANATPTIEGDAYGSAPSLNASPGDQVQLRTSFSDLGWLDTHTAIIDWGDGSVEVVDITVLDSSAPDPEIGVVVGSHVYGAVGTYAVTVVITDDEGGTASQTTVVEVASAGRDSAKDPEPPAKDRDTAGTRPDGGG